ncbi:formimidoylglutamase [Ralstonia pickettii]|nr:formimidoylglutamase [Ralstonia pickettii]
MYKNPDKGLWSGRVDSYIDEDSFRLHQTIDFLADIDTLKKESAFYIVGFESDEGVRRNKGRVGAAKAPNQIRSSLSNLPSSILRGQALIDIGNISCEDEKLEEAQEELGERVSKILSSKGTPIILGGGHETLYGHYLGARNYLGKNAKLGIINIDAHFDMRDEEIPSSGTMFKQILESDKNAGYLCLGIQPFGNTKSLFQDAERLGCTYLLEDAVTENKNNEVYRAIDNFSKKYDAVILTLCTDSIAASEAPGVSAPGPFGLSSKTVRKLLRYIVMKKNTLSFDISEVNPLVDENEKTIRLASYLIGEVLHHFHQN